MQNSLPSPELLQSHESSPPVGPPTTAPDATDETKESAAQDIAGVRVLVLAPQPFYQDRGTPIAVAHVLAALGRNGVSVDLVTFPVGRDIQLPGLRITRAGRTFGIRGVPIGLSATKLLFDAFLAVRARQMCRARPYSAIYAVEEAMFPALLLGRRFAIPLIYDMQSSIPQQLASHWLCGTGALQGLLRWMEGRFIRGASVVACSAGLETQVRARFPSALIEAWRYPAAAHAVPAAASRELRRTLAIADCARVIYYGGNFAGYQGINMLLAAVPQVLSKVPEAVFLLVGATEHRRGLERSLAGIPAHACRVVPRVSRSAIAEYLALAEVAVSARLGGSNLPLKIIDYMAAGKAIVATDHPAHRAALDDTVALLVEPTSAGLADGIASLLLDRPRAAALGAAARMRAEESFGIGEFDRQVLRILGRALCARPQAAAVRRSGAL